MSDHDLYRQNSLYHCSICKWAWESKPRSQCPGVQRYSWGGAAPAHLLSESRMNRAGYKLTQRQAPRGMVQNGVGDSYWLYSIYEAERKPRTKLAPDEAIARLEQREAEAEARQQERKRQRELCWYLERDLDRIEYLLNGIQSRIDWNLVLHDERNLRLCCRGIIDQCQHAKALVRKFYPLPQPKADDAVLGGNSQPRSDDAVLGGKGSSKKDTF